jgi:hypothetical protein
MDEVSQSGCQHPGVAVACLPTFDLEEFHRRTAPRQWVHRRSCPGGYALSPSNPCARRPVVRERFLRAPGVLPELVLSDVVTSDVGGTVVTSRLRGAMPTTTCTIGRSAVSRASTTSSCCVARTTPRSTMTAHGRVCAPTTRRRSTDSPVPAVEEITLRHEWPARATQVTSGRHGPLALVVGILASVAGVAQG